MGLKFHPKPGTILICDYSTGFIPPEMIKRRPVIVISPKLKHRNDLAAVVPLSTSPPHRPQNYHCRITLDPPLPPPFDSPEMWVKGDMVSVVSFTRLDLVRTGRDQYGKRKYLKQKINLAQLRAVKECVLHGLGFGQLTPHL